jgi:hypothetical protein
MNHTATKNLVPIGMIAAITAALTGTVVITIQTAGAYGGDSNYPNGNSIDKENSGTNSKFKQKEKNNCNGFANCTNTATETLVPLPECVIP